MPELYIDQFTRVDGVEPGDVWCIQRRVGGSWVDYKVPNTNMFGLDIASLTTTFDIQDLQGGAEVFAVTPGAGNMYIPLYAFAVYRPGATMPATGINLYGHINFESGGQNGLCAKFTMNGNTQGAFLAASNGAIAITTNATYSFGMDATTADGTITVFSQFAIVPI